MRWSLCLLLLLVAGVLAAKTRAATAQWWDLGNAERCITTSSGLGVCIISPPVQPPVLAERRARPRVKHAVAARPGGRVPSR